MGLRSSLLRAGRNAAFVTVIAGAAASGACAHEFDTTRREPEPLTLGDDLYQVLCDRVAATADPFDLEGRRSRVVCHPDAEGKYGDDYLEADQPMPEKVRVMVKHRARLIEALNATFPDVKYDAEGHESFHKDLKDLMSALVPLYDDDTMPESTRTLAAIFQQIFYDEPAPPDESPLEAAARKTRIERARAVRAALARLGGRKGYRTIATAIGVGRPMLAYPKMSSVVDTTLRLMGASGPAEPQLRKLLEVVELELATSKIDPPRKPLPGYDDRFTGRRNAPPKLTSEVLRNLLVDAPPLKADLSAPEYPKDWADAYADPGAPVLPFLYRDPRGYAAFASPPDLLDKDGDGLPDVDRLGQFLGKDGKPAAIATPFAFVTASGIDKGKGPRDALGRALTASGTPLYKYGDASRTMLRAILRDTQVIASPKNGALLDLAHAAVYQFGPRSKATKADDPTFGNDRASYPDPYQPGKNVEVRYRRFDAKQSPIVDLVYAFGRFLQLPKIHDYLEMTRQLTRDHPNEVARLVGAVLKIRDIANKPEYAGIDLDDKSPLWDEVMQVVAEMAAEPDVMRDVVESLADSRVLLLPKGMALFAAHKDVLDYNPSADSCWPPGAKEDKECPQLNDPWWNVTQGGPKKDPALKTDLSKPDTEDNRSLFQRFLSLINDASGVRACNKQGATIRTSLGPFNVKLPLFGTYDECEVLNVPDLGVFYLGCIAGGNIEGTSTPRCKLPVTDGFVSALNGIIGSTNVDKLLEGSSGILGLKQTPTIEALNRMVMWRNPNKFVSDLTEPIPTNVCPVATSKGTRKCASDDDLMMHRQRGTIFMGEAYDAVKGLSPVALPFVKKRSDGQGREHYFIRLVSIFHRHWSQGTNPVRCKDGGTPASNPKFCAKTNARAYEPILAEAFATDILPALHEVTKVLKGMKVNGKPGPEVVASLVRDLVDPKVGAAMKLTDRKGNAGTTWNDGRPMPQVSYYYLFANAINAFDKMWTGPNGEKDHALWRAARSKLVDQFLGVEAPGGDLTRSRFKNGGVRAATPILADLLEDRIAEHKAKGDFDEWAGGGMAESLEKTLGGPVFASLMDLQEKIYADKNARTALGELLVYLADKASGNDALASVLTATQDLMQVMGDDANMVPLYHALAVAAAPDGAVKRSLDLMERVGRIESAPEFAEAHGGRRVIAKVLANAVTPIGKTQITPIEVFIDVVSDLHRADPAVSGPFAPDDYGSVAKNVQEFLVDPTRGLEQFYAIVKNRNAE